jgi:nucleotide-binding universal stress UspA family protein
MYRHVTVAADFSPTLLPVLAEAVQVAKASESPLSIIHAASADMEKAQNFQDALDEVGWDGATELLWNDTEAPLEAILQAAEDGEADLLIAGAIAQDSELRHFLGSVAQGILKRAKCDVMLLPKPVFPIKPLRTVVAAVDFSAHNNPHLPKVVSMCEKLQVSELIVLGVYTPFVRAKLKLSSKKEANELLEKQAQELAQKTQVVVDYHVAESNTGFSACDFVQDLGRSLLAVHAKRGKNGLEFPSHMDWLFQVLPGNTWVISD